MVIFETDRLWIVFFNYDNYQKEYVALCDNEEDAKTMTLNQHLSYSTLEAYLENKREFDREAGYEVQTRIDDGLYADPYDE